MLQLKTSQLWLQYYVCLYHDSEVICLNTFGSKFQNFRFTYHSFKGQLLDDEEEDYSVPVNARPLPPTAGTFGPNRGGGPPTNGLNSTTATSAMTSVSPASTASNDAATRRRLPNRPQMPIFPQGQRALPGTNHIYGNIMPPQQQAPISPYISTATYVFTRFLLRYFDHLPPHETLA